MFAKSCYRNILLLTTICLIASGVLGVGHKSASVSIQSNQCNLPTCISDSVSVFDCTNPTAQAPWSFTPSYSEISCSGLSLVGDFQAGGLIQATYSLGTQPAAITMKFRLSSIGEAGEYVRVSAGGEVVYQIPIQSNATQLSGNCNNSCLAGGIQDIQFGFNYTSETLNLQIDSNILSSSSSIWSICGIEIELQDCPVWTDGSCINAVIFDSIQEFSCVNPTQSVSWKYSPPFSTYQSGGNSFVGPFGQSGKLVGRYTLPSAHESIYLSFSLNTAYDWREDAIRMFADGSEILNLQFDQQQWGDSQASDNSFTQNYFAEFNHSMDSLSLVMDSTMQGDFEGEAWGICDLLISVNQCPLGLYWNPSTQCDTVCPAGQYPDTSSRSCAQCIPSTCITNTTHDELSCSGPDLSFWRINGQSNVRVDSSGNDSFVGRYGQGDTVSKTFYALPAHKSINLEIKLFTIGPWDGELFTINADSRVVFSQGYNGQQDNTTSSDVCSNEIQETDISFRFAHTDSQITLEFSSTLASSGKTWGICGLEFTLISCPYGEYNDTNQGGACVQACSNGTSAVDQTGTCSSDVISSQPNPNGTNSTTPSNSTPSTSNSTPSTNSSTPSNGTTSPPSTSSGTPSNPTNPTPGGTLLIELIGETMITVEWIISEYYTIFIQIWENTYYYFGGFNTTTTIQRSYNFVSVQESVYLYFRFYIIDIWIEQIFWIKLNGVIIFMYEINGSNRWWDFAVQFETTETIISLEFGVSGGNCTGTWGISDVLIHSNQCPNGFAYCPVRQACVHSGTDLITSLILVQEQYIYRAAVDIPSWIPQRSIDTTVCGIGDHNLVTIIDGQNQLQFKPGTDLIVTSTQTNVVQYAPGGVCQHQNDIDYFEEIIFDLTQYQFIIEEWIFLGTASRGVTTINGFKSLGPIDFTSTVTRTLTGPSFFSSYTIRFTLWIIEIWIEEIFWIEVNSVRIFQTTISGTNTHHDIELQFDTVSQQLPLTFGVSPGQGTSVFKSWAISDCAIYFNPCPIYYVFDQGSMTCRMATQSIFAEIFTQHLDTIFVSTIYQVSWLSYILQGQFVPGTEIYGWYTQNKTTVVTTQTQWSSVITTSSPPVTGSYPAGRIQNELCGSSMGVTNWVVTQPNVPGAQVSLFPGGGNYYGDFKTGQTIISKQIYVQSSVQYISLKFILYLIEIWEGDIFWIEVNQVRIFEYSLTGVNIGKLITVYFENVFQTQYITLTFGSSSINSKVVSQGTWGLSDLAIHHNPCSLLNYFDSASQQCLSFVEYIDIFEILYIKSITDIQLDVLSTQPIWWTSQFQSTTVDQKIICSYQANSTHVSVKSTGTQSISYTSSSSTTVSTRTSISNIHTELCNQSEQTSGWLVNGVTTSLQSTVVGNHFCFGSLPATSVFSKGYTITSVYQSVTVRFLLYIFVEYFNEIFWITSSGYQVFSTTLKSTSGPINIEVSFPHTTSSLDLQMGFTTQGDTVSVLQWGISDMFIFGNPCKVGLCLDGTSLACQAYQEDSIFYSAFWNNQQNYANLPQTVPIWFNDILQNKGTCNGNDIINVLKDDLTCKETENVLYSSATTTTTTTQVQNTGFSNYEILTDLIGSSYETSSWTCTGNSQQLVRTQTSSQCYLGSFTGDTQLMRTWNLVSLHFTVSIRFRLYLIGLWDYELFWIKYGSNTVFQVWANGQDTYKDIEVQFDHYVQSLPLTFGTNAASNFTWAISDIAVLTNICSQQNFLTSECDYVGNSVFYALVQNAGSQILQTTAGEPVWLSKLLSTSAPSDVTTDYYGFYNSTIQVYEGDQLVSQAAPPSSDSFDFEAYLKNQIQSNQASNTTDNSSLSFSEGKASAGIVFEPTTGLVRCYQSEINNLFGQSLLTAGIIQLQVTIQANFGRTCFGVIETSDYNSLPLDSDLTNSSMVVCSDGTYFNLQPSGNLSIVTGGVYILNINPNTTTISITGQTGNASYTGTFTDPSNLYYTVQFNQQALVNLEILAQTTITEVTTVQTVVETVTTNVTQVSTVTSASKFKNLRGLRV